MYTILNKREIVTYKLHTWTQNTHGLTADDVLNFISDILIIHNDDNLHPESNGNNLLINSIKFPARL